MIESGIAVPSSHINCSHSVFLQYVLRVLYASSKDSGIAVPSKHWFYLTGPGEPISLSFSTKSGRTPCIVQFLQPPNFLHKNSVQQSRRALEESYLLGKKGFLLRDRRLCCNLLKRSVLDSHNWRVGGWIFLVIRDSFHRSPNPPQGGGYPWLPD